MGQLRYAGAQGGRGSTADPVATRDKRVPGGYDTNPTTAAAAKLKSGQQPAHERCAFYSHAAIL